MIHYVLAFLSGVLAGLMLVIAAFMVRLRVAHAAEGRRLREQRRAECRREWDVYNPCFASPVLPMPPVNVDGTIPIGPNTILPPLKLHNPDGRVPVSPSWLLPKKPLHIFNPSTPIE